MIHAITRGERDLFKTKLVAVVGATWLALTAWSVSRYAPYLNHEILEHLSITLSFEYLALLLIFMAGWLLMVVAMMLPGILPLVTRFQRKAKRTRPAMLLIAGYVGIWTIFGAIAHIGDVFVHEATQRFVWLEANEWVLSAALLGLAGVYQFTPLKRVSLRACRPGNEPGRGRHALRVGLRHGLWCVGCCGPLMLLMFGIACGNVLVMLLLGAILVVEKNASWGRRISLPLGLLLLGCSVMAGLIGGGAI